VHAAGAVVRGEREPRAVSLLPQLEQRGREQRERARLAVDVGHERVYERVIDVQPRTPGRREDRSPQLVAAHRADRDVVGAQHPPELGEGSAAAVEVGAQCDQHERSPARVANRGDERVSEGRALGLVSAGGEQLFELVDGDHEPALRRRCRDRLLERPHWLVARAHERDRPGIATGEHAVVERWQQTGLERRRLAAARRPDDAEQRCAREPRDHLGDEALAAEEDVGVLDLERGEALERADDGIAGRRRLGGALTRRLQRDDAGGEVVLGRLEARAVTGRAVGAGAELAGCLSAGPAARGAVHQLGHALGLVHQPRERRVVSVLARDRRNRGGVERPQGQIRPGGGLHRDEHELRPREVLELGGQLLRRVVEVVDDEQRRLPHRARALDHPPRGGRRAGAGHVEDAAALTVHLRRQLGGEPRLAGPRRAGQREPPAPPPGLAQRGELSVAAGERRPAFELRRQLQGQVERGVLAQDRVVEPAQLGAGLDTDLLDEHRARVPIGVERVGLATAAVEREHPQAMQALAQRLLHDQRLELAYHLGVAPGGEVLADRLLDRPEPQLLEPADLERRERLGGDVVERRTPPQRERVARRARGDEALEAADVQLAVAEAQLVAPPARDDLGAIVVHSHGLAQVRDVALDHLRCGWRRLLAPQAVDELLGGDR
jgi:hypothetical protein